MRLHVAAEATLVAALVLLSSSAQSQGSPTPLDAAKLFGDEVIYTPYGSVELQDTFIADGSSRTLYDGMDLQRATQAYIWAHPLVSMTTWRNEQARAYGLSGRGAFVVLQSYNEKLGIVTANLTTPYIFNFDNVDGDPLYIDYPAGATAGGVLDMWQRPVADLGLTGPDQGQGGSYIVVGPNGDPAKYEGKADFVIQSPTNNIFVGLRLLDRSPEFATHFRDAMVIAPVDGEPVALEISANADIPWSATAPRGVEYFKTLHQILNQEPVREQDKVWIAMLEPLGIELGKPFEPTKRQAKILAQGAALGELMQRNIQINPRFTEPYWEGTHWYKSFDFGVEQITDTKVELDERALWFYEAVTSSKGMVNPSVGKGQAYMTSKRDLNGELLRPDRTYRLRVPANAPVAQFWSLTLYSENTRRAYESGTGTIASASRDSTNDLVLNKDGSVDLYIGPSAPEGFERNHMPTIDNDGWFVYFRLYGPLDPWFDKTWSLPDFEPVEVGSGADAESGSGSAEKVDTGVGPKGVALESSPSFERGGVPVDMLNVVRAETAKYFAEETILSGGNAMRHERTGIDLDNQTVIRSNFDLIYSYGVYDVSGGLTVRVPEYDLYQSVQIFDEDHITLAAVYPGEQVTLGPDDVTHGEHVYLFMRTQARTSDAAGLQELNARQDAVEITAGSGKPYASDVTYDVDSFNALRASLLQRVAAGAARSELGFVSDLNDIVFPHYQLVSIAGWAGQPASEAFYILLSGGDDAARQGRCSGFTFSAPDLQYTRGGYWSITLYDKEGWVATDAFNTNSLKAKPNADGTYTVHFNCGPDAVNNVNVVPNWNGLMRLYLPVTVEGAIAFRESLYENHPIVASTR